MFSTTYLQSFFYLMQTHAISSQRSQILRRTDTSCLCNIGTRSKPCDVSWLFWVYLDQTIQYKLFQELRIHLSTDSCLWSFHFVVKIVKAMFKSICLSLIFTPCCKYTYSKNNEIFLKSTSSELRQELFKLNRIAAASTRCFTFKLFLQCELNFKWLQTRQPFSTIFHAKFFIQVLCSLNFLRSQHFVQLKFVIVLLVTIVQHIRTQFVTC